METNTEKDEKICRVCKKTLVGESKSGLCPVCFNKIGSPAAGIGAVGIAGILYLGKGWAMKNGGKIVKGAIDAIKLIKS